MHSNKTLKESMLEDYVASNLSHFFHGLELIRRHERIANKGTVDIYARNSNGIDYYIEIKDAECNRLSIGQAVEYKAYLARVNPRARMVFVCREADEYIKELLSGIGIEILTFRDLQVPEEISGYETSRSLLMKLSPTEQKAYFAFQRKGINIARIEDLSSALDVPMSWAKNILSKLAKHGAAQRVGKGKYAIIPPDVMYGRKSYVIDPLVLASELMKGSEYYVAYYSAAQIHGIAEQMPFRTTVAVLRQLRPVKIGNALVSFVTLKKSRFFGYEEVRYLNVVLNVSDLEKTIVDCIDRQDLSSGIAEVVRIFSNAIETRKLNWKRLVAYVRRFRSHALAQRLGLIIEHLERYIKVQVDPEIIEELLRLAGSRIYPLDIKAPRKGKLSKKWKIIDNAGFLEI